jgi:U4/U6.U5 tri-snRNP-associated protein 1
VRNRQALNSKLKGSTLGDGDEPEDTLQWIKKLKRRKQELGEGPQEELDDIDDSIQNEYIESQRFSFSTGKGFINDLRAGDLVGLKVSHPFESMVAGEARIFTLKDSQILNDEGKYIFMNCLIL